MLLVSVVPFAYWHSIFTTIMRPSCGSFVRPFVCLFRMSS